MPSLTDDNPFGGGGAPGYLKGTEVFIDLSAQAGVAYPMTTAQIGKTVVLYSSVEGQKFQFLAANNASLAVGKGIGVIVTPGSKAIKILNGGTAGTDPILEAFMLPGASASFFLTSVSVPSAAAGTWKAYGAGMYHGPVPVTLPNVRDPGIDSGGIPSSNIIPAPYWGPDTFCRGNGSNTLFSFVAVNAAGTAVLQWALTYVHATDVWTWGSSVSSVTSAGTIAYPRVVGIGAASFGVVAYDSTAAAMKARGSTVAGTTITQGTAIASGAWSVNPSSSDSCKYGTLIADSTTTFFYGGRYDGTHLGITHFSLSGANLTQDGGAAFGSSAHPTYNWIGGYCPSANNLDLGIPDDNASYGLTRYTYAAGSVTRTKRLKANVDTTNMMLQIGDATSRTYFEFATANGIRIVPNAGLTDVNEQQQYTLPVIMDTAAPVALNPSSGNIRVISDSEILCFSTQAQTAPTMVLVDPTMALRARPMIAPGTSSDFGPFAHIIAAMNGFGQQNTYTYGVDLNPTNRRMAMAQAIQTQSLAAINNVSAIMYDLPRNYDKAVL